jgi:hypothetical protein
MNPVAFFLGGFVLSIAWFRMDCLIRRNSFIIILWISVLSSVVGISLIVAYGFSYLAGFTFCPLLTLGLFRLLLWMFLKWVKREPIDTFLKWDAAFPDALFNVLYFMLGGVILVFVPILAARLRN